MQENEYKNASLVNTDYSENVIDRMKTLYGENDKLSWLVADMRDMPQFEDESFDAVIDKAAMDAIMVCIVYSFFNLISS